MQESSCKRLLYNDLERPPLSSEMLGDARVSVVTYWLENACENTLTMRGTLADFSHFGPLGNPLNRAAFQDTSPGGRLAGAWADAYRESVDNEPLRLPLGGSSHDTALLAAYSLEITCQRKRGRRNRVVSLFVNGPCGAGAQGPHQPLGLPLVLRQDPAGGPLQGGQGDGHQVDRPAWGPRSGRS